jgi:hypothetical protein
MFYCIFPYIVLWSLIVTTVTHTPQDRAFSMLFLLYFNILLPRFTVSGSLDKYFPNFFPWRTPKIFFNPRNLYWWKRLQARKFDRGETFCHHRWGGSAIIRDGHNTRQRNTILNTNWPVPKYTMIYHGVSEFLCIYSTICRGIRNAFLQKPGWETLI